jgi:hypothetical protein
VRTLVDAGLIVYSDDPRRSRLILNAVVRAKVPLAYGIEKTGLTKVGDRHVFALPSGVIEADGKGDGASIVVWRGTFSRPHARVKGVDIGVAGPERNPH